MTYGVDNLSPFPFLRQQYLGIIFSRQYHATVIRGIKII